MNEIKESNFLIYETTEGKVDIDVILKDETIWLTQKSMAELFDVEQPAIAKHLINIYNEDELLKDSTYSKMELVQKEGTRNVKRNIEFYNLLGIELIRRLQLNLGFGQLVYLKIILLKVLQ